MRTNPSYSPQNRFYFAQFVDGLDINYPVPRVMYSMAPYAEDSRNNRSAEFFDFNYAGRPTALRIAPWQKNKLPVQVGDTALWGAMSWDGPFKRWVWCENVTASQLGNYTSVYQNDNFFTDEPTLLTANIKQNPYHLVHLIGRISQPTANGTPRHRLIWVEWPGLFPQSPSDANHYLYSADLDGRNVRLELRQSSTSITSGAQTYRTIDSWTFNQETGDIFTVLREWQAINGVTQTERTQLYKLAWDRGGQRYSRLFVYGNVWTGSQSQPLDFIAQPTLSRSLDDAVIFPVYDMLSSSEPGNFGIFRSHNRILIYSQSSLQQIGEIELPNPAGIIPDPFDPDFDENYPIGMSVAAWTSELTDTMFLWVGDNLGQVFPNTEDQWEGMYEMNLDGSNMRKMIRYATRSDAGLGTFLPSQNIFLGPGCYGAWECCT